MPWIDDGVVATCICDLCGASTTTSNKITHSRRALTARGWNVRFSINDRVVRCPEHRGRHRRAATMRSAIEECVRAAESAGLRVNLSDVARTTGTTRQRVHQVYAEIKKNR